MSSINFGFLIFIIFVFQVPNSAGSLHEVLTDVLKHVDDKLLHQLRMVIQVSIFKSPSRTLQSFDVSELVKHICLAPSHASLSDTLDSVTDSLEDFTGLESHPVRAITARRTLLACVALRWITHRKEKLDEKAEKHLANITKRFYDIHIRSVAERGLLEYLHISKSGGTTFSAAADKNGCIMAPGIGQLEKLGDMPRWINGTAFEEITEGTDIMWSFYETAGRPAGSVSCRQRFSYIRLLQYNYVSNEFTMLGGGDDMRETHVCPQGVNVVTLRDPSSRLVSHIHFILARMKKRLKRGIGSQDDEEGEDGGGDNGGVGRDEGSGSETKGPELFRNVFCMGNATTWQRVAPPVVDNYITRSFIGERAFHTPLGGIGMEEVDTARHILLQFDLVLDLDAGPEVSDFVLRQGLGWHVKMSEIHARSSSSVYSKLNYSTSECRNEKLVRDLQAVQDPDRHVYSFGRVLALLDYLHLAMASKLGLQPEVDMISSTSEDRDGATKLGPHDDDGDGDMCGLIGAMHRKTRHLSTQWRQRR